MKKIDTDLPVASDTDVNLTNEELLAQLAQLQAENAHLKGEFQRATDAARASAVMLSQFQEVAAGKTEPDEDGRQEDLWEYTIDLALNGGEGIKVNGRTFYHGQTYLLTTNQLRMIKDMVYRTHLHEQIVFGHSKDNFYRQQNSRSITTGRSVNLQ